MTETEGALDLRVSDADRERTAEQLREHTAEGRLTVEEFSARLDDVYAAKTARDLAATLRDLPPRPVRARRAPVLPERVPAPLMLYVLVATLMVVLWAATGGGYFWPVWPLLGWGIPLMRRVWSPAPRTHRPGGCL
jgi:hypothetical protein